MEKKEIVIVILGLIVVGVIGYYSGYGKGVLDSFTMIAENVEDLLDMELTPRAKMVLTSSPQLLKLILTPETLEEHFSSIFKSAQAKGGIGPTAFGKDLLFNGSLLQ